MPAVDALNRLNERCRRFIAASACQSKTSYSPDPAVSNWSVWTWSHPIDGWAMAYAAGQSVSPQTPSADPSAQLAFAAVRTGADAAAIEVTAGLDLHWSLHSRDVRHSLHRPGLVGPGELIPSWDTAAAYVGSVKLRCAWSGVTSAPDVVELRTFPRLVQLYEILLPFWRELPDQHWEGGHPEVDEVSITGRSSTFGAGAKLTVAIPWFSREHELMYSFDLAHAYEAKQAVRAAVTPAPPAEDG